jgi:hypothetical protein
MIDPISIAAIVVLSFGNLIQAIVAFRQRHTISRLKQLVPNDPSNRSPPRTGNNVRYAKVEGIGQYKTLDCTLPK